ncbi:Hypothetical protein NTJ_10756 [Nesidiocoris tenuis]|nr:Hypothetical protein NTJ_10756 [Nesidiocoris tenuis]
MGLYEPGREGSLSPFLRRALTRPVFQATGKIPPARQPLYRPTRHPPSTGHPTLKYSAATPSSPAALPRRHLNTASLTS